MNKNEIRPGAPDHHEEAQSSLPHRTGRGQRRCPRRLRLVLQEHDQLVHDHRAGHHETTAPAAQTIVEIAAGNPDFSTLVSAVKAAGLVETCQARGRTPSSHPPTRRSPSSPPERSTPCSSRQQGEAGRDPDLPRGGGRHHGGRRQARTGHDGQRRHRHVSTDGSDVILTMARATSQGRQDRHRRLEWRHRRHRHGAASATS